MYRILYLESVSLVKKKEKDELGASTALKEKEIFEKELQNLDSQRIMLE